MIQSNRRNEVWKKINYMVLQQRVPVAPQQWWFGRVWNSRALKPGIMSSLSLLGLEGYEITWFSNMYHNIISIILGLEGCEITWFSNNSVPFICYTLDLEGCEIAGYSNIKKIKEPLFCKEAKLHGAQVLQPLKITNVQVWKKIKLQGSQTCYCAAKTRKLQGTQTFTGWSLRQQRVWQKIKLHGTQMTHCMACKALLVWKKMKLHGTQTR